MADILTKIANHTRLRVEVAKQKVPLEWMKSCALDKDADTGFPLEQALRREGISLICECKKGSPSKGVIAEEYDPLAVARDYRLAGADAISILTEPNWFLGSTDDLQNVAGAVDLPCLRKDFVVDEYMIYEAKTLGASAVLLIVALLSDDQLKEYAEICDGLGLSALVEAHDKEEVERATRAGARIIGVNNRNLKDFSVDLGNAGQLRSVIPKDILFVAESGITGPEDAERLRRQGADGLLVGEAMMRSEDRRSLLAQMRVAADEGESDE